MQAGIVIEHWKIFMNFMKLKSIANFGLVYRGDKVGSNQE